MRKINIICRNSRVAGIGAILYDMTKAILYSINNDSIPIIDLKHYDNQYFKKGRIYKDNTWEYFFEQPYGITLDNILEEDEVSLLTFAERSSIDKYSVSALSPNPDKKLKELHKKFIKFNPETLKYINNKYDNIIGNKNNILGILARGTDYTKRRTYGEPIQPKINTLIKQTRLYLKKYPEITNIYIATEDAEIFSLFKREFGNILLDNNQFRFKYSEKKLLANIDTGTIDNATIAKDYLTSLYILSKCKYFIGGMCGGTQIAWLLQDSWQDYKIFNLGLYGKTFKERIFSKTILMRNNIDYRIYYLLGFRFKKRI